MRGVIEAMKAEGTAWAKHIHRPNDAQDEDGNQGGQRIFELLQSATT